MNTSKELIPTDDDYKYLCVECEESPSDRHDKLFHANVEKEALFYGYKNAEEILLFFAKIVKGPMLRHIQQFMDTLADSTRKPMPFTELKQCLKIINSYVSEVTIMQQQRGGGGDDDDDVDEQDIRDVEGFENFAVLDGVCGVLHRWKHIVDERIQLYKEEEKNVISTLTSVLSTVKDSAQHDQFLLVRSLDINALYHSVKSALKQFDAILSHSRDVKEELKSFLLALEWIQLLYQVCIHMLI